MKDFSGFFSVYMLQYFHHTIEAQATVQEPQEKGYDQNTVCLPRQYLQKSNGRIRDEEHGAAFGAQR
jgi:hypothetical protein